MTYIVEQFNADFAEHGAGNVPRDVGDAMMFYANTVLYPPMLAANVAIAFIAIRETSKA